MRKVRCPFELVVVASMICVASSASVEAHCPAMEGSREGLGALDDEVRLRFLEQGLAAGARKARVWAWSWAAVHSTSIAYDLVAQVWLAPGDGHRVDGLIGAAASTLGLATLLVRPLPVMRDQRWLERQRGSGASVSLAGASASLDGASASFDGGRCALLAEAEQRLIGAARAEAFGRSALVHLVNFGFNIGVGLVLGVGFGHWEQAAISALGGTALGELQIITQPHGEIELLRRYRAAEMDAHADSTPTAIQLVPSSGAGRGGLAIAFSW